MVKTARGLTQCELDAERIDQAYTTLCEKLVNYADSVFPRKRYRAHLKPYWTSELSELHNGMMRARGDWCEAGRPRGKESGSFLHYKNLKLCLDVDIDNVFSNI